MNARLQLRIVCLLCISAALVHGQKIAKNEGLLRAALLSDLRTLALEMPKLDGPLARALAGAEIADAAWTLDRKWARQLLKEAYELTYLTEEELRKIGPEPPGTPPRPPTAISRARDDVRRRILSVARRDKSFADQLIADSADHVTKDDRQMMYAQLTRMALDAGDNPAAIRSIQDNIAIDPTQLMLVQSINDLALKDRSAADKLILQYVSNLSTAQIANGRVGQSRGELVLRFVVFPNSFFPDPNKPVPSPGPEVMRAYVRYVVDTLTAMELSQPLIFSRERPLLLSAWLPLNQYAPEFRERFMQLEAAMRPATRDGALPTKSNEELDQETREQKRREALNSDEPNDASIESMIVSGEFDTARKLINKLSDGERKTQFTEKVNTKEAISLAGKGDLLGAQNLAERLTTVNSILQVYPLIIEGYAKRKDQANASAVVHAATEQLKKLKPATEASLLALGKLAKAVLPLDTLLAAELVDDFVTRANAAQIDTSQGRIGFDSDLLKNFAAKDEVRARSAAENFKDRLQRVVALAAIYQWKAALLQKSDVGFGSQYRER